MIMRNIFHSFSVDIAWYLQLFISWCYWYIIQYDIWFNGMKIPNGVFCYLRYVNVSRGITITNSGYLNTRCDKCIDL